MPAHPSLGPQARPWTVECSRPVVGPCWASPILCTCEIVKRLYVFGGGYQPAAGSQATPLCSPAPPRPSSRKITCPPAKGSCRVYCSEVKAGGQDNLLGKKRPDCHTQPLGTEAGLQLLKFARTSSGEARGGGTRKSAEACDHPRRGVGRAVVGPEKGQLAGGQATSQTGGACLQRSGWAKACCRAREPPAGPGEQGAHCHVGKTG